MKKTALYEKHLELNAKMIDFAGYLMPVQYEGVVAEHISVKKVEIPSGKEVFDWTIPDEWNINDGYIIEPNGEKLSGTAILTLPELRISFKSAKAIEFKQNTEKIIAENNLNFNLYITTSPYVLIKVNLNV